MTFAHFSKNGNILPIDAATISLNSIEYMYGFGVYETIRVAHGIPYFLTDHCQRLLASAKIIGLDHPFSEEFLGGAIKELIRTLGASTAAYNLKVLLIGGARKEHAQLFILPLAALFPDKKLYRDGVGATIVEYERLFPQAKTLNMLPSYIHYRKAKEAGCYDALLQNRCGAITEGTRTNFFGMSGTTLITAPDETVLAGVTRKNVLSLAAHHGFTIEFRSLTSLELKKIDAAFFTGTSIGIMPITSIDGIMFEKNSQSIRKLMKHYDDFKKTCNGKTAPLAV
jgi:branched-subunit amino acid aminotransferase/4-amino-4-deoxychorismate lyase